MRTYYIAQVTLLSALCWPKWEGNPKNRGYIYKHMGFPHGSVIKNPLAGAAGDADSIPGSGRSPGGGHGNLLQYYCLQNPLDRGVWWAIVHRVAKSWTGLKRLNMQGNIMNSFSLIISTTLRNGPISWKLQSTKAQPGLNSQSEYP